MYSSKTRHLAKTITWRIIGTLSTILIAWLITGSPVWGLRIGAVELTAKMCLYYLHERIWYKIDFGLAERSTRKIKSMAAKSAFIVPQTFFIGRSSRQRLLNQRGMAIWFTGLSGSGKSTLANGLEQELFKAGYKTFILDGDNLRGGLCKDLGFSDDDRSENIRRVAEVAKLMIDSGVIVLAAFVTPFEKDRELVAKLLGDEDLVSIYLDCPLNICEQRDVKGLYKKARSGELKSFTGISSPYEMPQHADLMLKTSEFSKEVLVKEILDYIKPKIELKPMMEIVKSEIA
ncbi:MAG TPA: adenylyl-sulfate kinase [Mucilaginibacter sp.]|jgi:adenylylsulfate kinase|nr:adenylyl-sulfate kinase [Mucilaginibacter sp.]